MKSENARNATTKSSRRRFIDNSIRYQRKGESHVGKRHQYPAARRPPPSSINDKPCQPERNPLADHDDSVFHRRLQRGREISCASARTDSRSPPTQPRRFLGPRLPGLWTTVIGCGGSEIAARSDSRHGQLSRVTATGSE